MKIALAQIECIPGNPAANSPKFGTYAARAKAAGCDTIIFPEMSDTGYTMPAITESAGTWPGPAYDAAAAAAADNGITLVCGLSERTGDGIYNTLAFFGSTGDLLARYRKTHLFSPAGEDMVCRAGDDLVTVISDGACWGLSICYDLRFPELYRTLAMAEADILLNCAAWPAARPTHWDHLTRARAIENQAFFIGVNRVGTDGNVTMNGHSRVIAPDGRIIAEADGESEELLTAEIDLTEIEPLRTAIPTLPSRRPDLYANPEGD